MPTIEEIWDEADGTEDVWIDEDDDDCG